MPSSSPILEPIKTENKVVESISSDNTENSQKTVTESLNLPIATADGATIILKLIMIPYSEDITEIIRKTAQDCDKKFYVKTVGCWMKVFADSLPIKEKKIIEFLINNKVQFYFTPDTQALLKAVIRVLPTQFKTEDIKYALQGEEF